jgi:IS5 family transposase
MKQADLGLSLTTKRTRKREFLAQMERVVRERLAVPS